MITENNYKIERVLNIYVIGLILFVLNIILFLKFGEKFGDIFIDSSREVTVPLRILDGQVIYKDFHYEYGPIVPYFFALICKIFGSGLDVFRITGLTVSIAISLIIFKISEVYINRIYALLSSIIFIFLFAYHSEPINIFNYILPYSYVSIIGLLCLLLVYLNTLKYLMDRKIAPLLFLIVSISVCMLSKLEIILSTLIVLMFLPLLFNNNNSCLSKEKNLEGGKRNAIILFWIIPIAVLLFVYIYYFDYVNNEIYYLVKKNLNNLIGRTALGLNNIEYHFTKAITSFLFFITCGTLFILIDNYAIKKARYNYIQILVFITILLITTQIINVEGYDFLFNSSSLILLPFTVYLLGIVFSRGKDHRCVKHKVMLVITLSSLALTFRMAFNNTTNFYGFYLLVPSSMCIIVVIYYYIPLIARKYFNKRTKLLKIAFTIYYSTMCYSSFSNTVDVSEEKNKRLTTDKGALYLYEYQYDATQYLINDFKSSLNKEDTVMVLPEGYMLNYFLDVVPTSYNNSHLPDLTADSERELSLIQEIDEKKFDYIFIVPRYAFEWDLPVLGKDYLIDTIKHIDDTYNFYALYGTMPFSEDGKYGVLILKRK